MRTSRLVLPPYSNHKGRTRHGSMLHDLLPGGDEGGEGGGGEAQEVGAAAWPPGAAWRERLRLSAVGPLQVCTAHLVRGCVPAS